MASAPATRQSSVSTRLPVCPEKLSHLMGMKFARKRMAPKDVNAERRVIGIAARCETEGYPAAKRQRPLNSPTCRSSPPCCANSDAIFRARASNIRPSHFFLTKAGTQTPATRQSRISRVAVRSQFEGKGTSATAIFGIRGVELTSFVWKFASHLWKSCHGQDSSSRGDPVPQPGGETGKQGGRP